MSTKINFAIGAALLALVAAPPVASAQSYGNYAATVGEGAPSAQSVAPGYHPVASDARASVGKVRHHAAVRQHFARRLTMSIPSDAFGSAGPAYGSNRGIFVDHQHYDGFQHDRQLVGIGD